ncbi:hypothetical protein BKA70DRAFT_1567328, partial [Coprinopsis sp. MPI-PUGE-AT-0042]
HDSQVGPGPYKSQIYASRTHVRHGRLPILPSRTVQIWRHIEHLGGGAASQAGGFGIDYAWNDHTFPYHHEQQL